MPYVIVLGNEKGGTGKSTVSMHIITSLLKKGYSVGSIDVDARQGTLSRYVQNRTLHCQKMNIKLPMPIHKTIFMSALDNVTEAHMQDKENFEAAFNEIKHCDYVVIDTPGNDTNLSRVAHSYASTLITPVNDSFIDLDVLVHVDGQTQNIIKPSIYAAMVWEQKKEKAIRENGSIDWIVLRNRMSNVFSNNKDDISRILQSLSKRIGFRLASGFSDRVIFKELFLKGITLVDLKETRMTLNLSHIAARNELMNLMREILENQPQAAPGTAVIGK